MINHKINFPLKQYNTFGFDVRADRFVTFSTEEELAEIISRCKEENSKRFILGGGSNILFTKDFDGVVIHPVSKSIIRTEDTVIADAGVVWDDLVEWVVQNDLGGIENLSHIPGSVGASPVQNIGAYGVEVKDVIQWVEYLDTQEMKIVRIAGENCEFGYRESIFKLKLRDRAVVLRVAFKLTTAHQYNIEYGDVKSEVERLGGVSLQNIRKAITTIRSAKLPDPAVTGNAGSFFKNPVIENKLAGNLLQKYPSMPHFNLESGTKIPAGWLIDQAGWKGYRDGDAGVHPKQALVLVNYGSATALDILDLADKITADIHAKFGITLEKEVNVW